MILVFPLTHLTIFISLRAIKLHCWRYVHPIAKVNVKNHIGLKAFEIHTNSMDQILRTYLIALRTLNLMPSTPVC